MTEEEWERWIDEVIASEPKDGAFTAPIEPGHWYWEKYKAAQEKRKATGLDYDHSIDDRR